MNFGMPPISTDDPDMYDEGDFAGTGNEDYDSSSEEEASDSNDSDDD
jgi:hypothetical protein